MHRGLGFHTLWALSLFGSSMVACGGGEGSGSSTIQGKGGSSGGKAGTAGAAGTQLVGGASGTGTGAGTGTGGVTAACDPAVCPALAPGMPPCCLTAQGPCGYLSGQSCVDPNAMGGAGGTLGAGGSAGSAGGGGTGFGPVDHACNQPPPPGAPQPPAPRAYSGGACPALQAGFNTIAGGRKFRLAVPANLSPNERLPVIFLWHWLGGSADSFYTKAEVQNAVDTQRFLAVIPESKGDGVFKWPFEASQLPPRVEEEFRFFDDMLSCVSQAFNVNPSCVSSAGVSAGALWTAQLASGRGEYLSSFLSLSGGTGGFIRPWGNPAHKLPGIVLWGGPSDNCFGLMNFEATSANLESALAANGHFMIECLHNCGHAEPPFEAPPGLSRYAGLWRFVFDHPYWLGPGQSPYQQSGIAPGIPSWCAIGKGSAKSRAGACPNPSQC